MAAIPTNRVEYDAAMRTRDVIAEKAARPDALKITAQYERGLLTLPEVMCELSRIDLDFGVASREVETDLASLLPQDHARYLRMMTDSCDVVRATVARTWLESL